MPVLQTGLAKSAAADYTIDQSLRFNRDDSAYLDRTFTAGNRQVFTISVWAKLGQVIEDEYGIGFLSEYTDTNNRTYFRFGNQASGSPGGSTAGFFLYGKNGGSAVVDLSTNAAYRDPSAWYHVCIVVDVTQTTETDRVKIYVNGVQETLSISTMWAEDTDTRINSATVHEVGIPQVGTSFVYGDGYLAEYYFIDGQALTPASFGETNSATNQWVPIEVTGMTYGTNGFYQKYSSTELAASFTDSSSSAHTITANGDVTNTRAQNKVGSSSIKFDGTGDYLTVPASSDWDFGTGDFTIECWLRMSTVQYCTLYATGHTTSGGVGWFYEDPDLRFYFENTSVLDTSVTLSADTWYHVALSRSGTTIRTFVDGVELDSATSSQDIDLTSNGVWIGAQVAAGPLSFINGYVDEYRVSNSARYTSDFTPSTTAFTADSNTKLLIHSDFDGGLGADSSGNTNDFSATNLVATDQVLDSPTNNFATLNPIVGTTGTTNVTLSEGNSRYTNSDGTYRRYIPSTIDMPLNTGKYYCEFIYTTSSSSQYDCVGVGDSSLLGEGKDGGSNVTGIWAYRRNGNADDEATGGTSGISYGSSWATSDVIGIAYDSDNGSLTFYKNNVSQGEWVNDIGVDVCFFIAGYLSCVGYANFGADSSFAGNETAQGNQDGNGIGDFYYEPPSGYLALCTDNLPTPEIALPGDYFNTKLYTGDGATTLAVTGVGFQPDFTWIKNRDQADDHTLVDSVRGATNYLVSNETDAEVDDSTFVASLDSDGFTVGDDVVVNTSTENYASWNWKAGGAASSNTDGTITSSVSANTTSGFSIGTYTGNGTAGATVGHGLSQAPELIIVKCYDGLTFNWTVGWGAGGAAWTDYMHLDTTAAAVDDLDFWRDTYPTSSVFTIGSNGNVNYNNDDFVFYAFHSVDGYSKVGSYVGNGDADGAFVYTGFKPAFVIVKRLADEGWQMFDSTRSPYNVVVDSLTPNGNGVEITYGIDVDIVSNGFKFRGDDGSCNASDDYIYIAIAKSPFQYSNAR